MSTEGKKERRNVEEEELLEGQLVFKGPQGDKEENEEESD